VSQFLAMWKAAKDYQDQHRTTWTEIERQVRCIPPAEWADLEDWQTKVYFPLQAKTSETARARLSKILFGVKRFYYLSGIDRKDKEMQDALMELMDILIDTSNFPFQKEFVLQEAVDLGTSFLFVGISEDRKRLLMDWVSCFELAIDPSLRHDFSEARYAIRELDRDLQDLIDEWKANKSLYSKEDLDALVEGGITAIGTPQYQGKPVRNIIDFQGNSVSVPQGYAKVQIKEFWGWFPTVNADAKDRKEGDLGVSYENVVMGLANDSIMLRRKDENAYEELPFVSMRIKMNKYDFYADGYMLTTMGIQDLMNSMIRLGFDTSKLHGLGIIGVDDSKVADGGRIEFRPRAVWRFRGSPSAAVSMMQQPTAMADVLNGVEFLDRMHQDASGVTRHAQGTQPLSGSGPETLGEYKLKLAATDERFLSIASLVEYEFVVPLIRKIFYIITHLMTQEGIDELLGMKDVPVMDPTTGQPIMGPEGQPQTQPVSRLELKALKAQAPHLSQNFKAMGLTSFLNKVEEREKLKAVLEYALKVPELAALTKVQDLWKRFMQSAEIPDIEDILRSKEEVEAMVRAKEQAGQQALMAQAQAQLRKAGGNGQTAGAPVTQMGAPSAQGGMS